MATIKVQGGKVITKGGKVSCTCCGECCMYPAQALVDGIYSDDDLPDQITYNYFFNGNPGSIILNRSGDQFSATIGEVQFFVRTASAIPNFIWEYRIISPIGGYGPNGSQDCLISDRFNFPDSNIIADEFANTYSVSGPINGIVTRESLCVWQGQGLTLIYNGKIDQDFKISGTYKWTINTHTKSNPQNSPVGLYESGYSIS